MKTLQIDAILEKINKTIQEASLGESFAKKGQILEIKDGVATVVGLEDAMFSEIVSFANGLSGLVLDISRDSIGVLVLGDYATLKHGDLVSTTGKVFSIGVSDDYLGRVVDGLGNPIDQGKEIQAQDYFPIDRVAPGVITRKSVNVPLQTGIKAIDAMIPIGRGQRELIIGDRQTGKTTIAIDTILAQKNQDVICIYVAIGQKDSKIARVVQDLKEQGAMDYSVVVNASISSPSVLQYLAPYVGCAIGEYFMAQGKDALIIYDDLTKHAIAYREISLLLKRPPGREAYPGDVFYLHSRLLERAARLNENYGGGSLTALPVIETQAGDISAYIPTNVISITDGQIFLETDLFNSGIKPAINVGYSVSRVGGSAQTPIMKKVAGTLKLELAAFRELESFSKFGADLDPSTQAKLSKGEKLVEILKQRENSPISFSHQAVLIYIALHGYIEKVKITQIAQFEQSIYEKLATTYLELDQLILEEKKLSTAIEEKIHTLAEEVITEING